MKPRALILLAALVLGAVALLVGRRLEPHAKAKPAAASAERRHAPAARPPPPVDAALIRDVFRFAERPAPMAPRGAEPEAELAPGAPLPAGALPRLVGLVRRSGRLLAALGVDGDVVLAGPGETVAGVTVLAVGEESVRLRRADGSEETLVLP